MGIKEQLGESSKRFRKPSFGHLLFILFNWAALVLSICVLSSCRTTFESRYALYSVNAPGSVKFQRLGNSNKTRKVFNDEDKYMFGFSGICHTLNNTTRCKPKFPNAFNVSAAILADTIIIPSNISTSNTTLPNQDLPATIPPNYHAFIQSLSSTICSILILSIFLSLCSSLLFPSAYEGVPHCILLLDTLIHLTILCLAHQLAMQNTGFTDLLIRRGAGWYLILAGFLGRLVHLLGVWVTMCCCCCHYWCCRPVRKPDYELAQVEIRRPDGTSWWVKRWVPAGTQSQF